RKATFEDYVGIRGLKRLGKKKWRRAVFDVVARLIAALEPDYVVLGGGNVKKLKELPPKCRAGANANAFIGGFRLWQRAEPTPLNAPAPTQRRTNQIILKGASGWRRARSRLHSGRRGRRFRPTTAMSGGSICANGSPMTLAAASASPPKRRVSTWITR